MSRSSRPGPADEDLRKVSHQLHYEIDMLIRSAESLVRMQSIGDCFGQNEAIETLAVHARNLRCFFYAPGKGNEHNDEVYAKDYRFQDGAEWARARGNEPAVIFGVSGNLRVSRSLTWVGTARHS